MPRGGGPLLGGRRPEAGVGPAVGRHRPKVALHQLRRHGLAAVVLDLQHHRPVGPVADVRVDEGEADGPHAVIVGRRGGDALAVEVAERHAGARRHVARRAAVETDLVPGAQGLAPAEDGYGHDHPGKHPFVYGRRQLAAHHADELVALFLQFGREDFSRGLLCAAVVLLVIGLVRCDVTAVDDLDVTPIEEISAEVPVEGGDEHPPADPEQQHHRDNQFLLEAESDERIEY